MADGTRKPIAEVAVGDMVLGADEQTGAQVPNEVTKTLVHEGSYKTLVINNTLVVTPEHRISVSRNGVRSWMDAGEIEMGDVLLSADGGPMLVYSITPGKTLPTVYNLTTYPSHTYYAGGVWVHNVKN